MSEEKKEVKRLSASRLKMFDKTDAVAPVSPRLKPKKDNQNKTASLSPTKTSSLQVLQETSLPDNPIFHAPMVLVSTDNGKTTCNQTTLSKLREIQQPLNIVSVVGTLRTGKSFLLNKLARPDAVRTGACFEIGHTTDAVTKGIWVMCRPHPTKENQVLVLLDTEGIDDPDKVDIEDDKNLFILATLLSNTLVYNTRGNFDKTTIDKFKFLNKIKTSIQVNGTEEDDSILDFFFPNFVLTLRDVTLDIKAKDADTFLEEKLNMKSGTNLSEEALKEYNLPRMLVRRYFKKRKCFLFRKPVKSGLLKELLTLDESKLKEEFRQSLEGFRSYIFSCKPKSLKSGKAINGRMFCSLVLKYVQSIRGGDSPCLTSAMVLMAALENTYVVEKASEEYRAEMKRRIGSHIPSEKGLINYHKESMHAALEVLKAGLIIDDEQIYEEKAMTCFKEQFEKFKEIVKKDVEAKCCQLLGRLDMMKIQMKIKNRKYCTPTGYDEYMKDLDTLIKQYNREAGYMGSVALLALQEFLAKKTSEEEAVFCMVQEALGGKEGPERKNMKRLSVFREKDADIMKEEEEVEEAIRADIEMLQRNGLQNIGDQYLDMLTSKIEEIDRVKKELTRDNSYYKKLCKETDHWKNVFENATFSLSHYKRQLKPIAGQQSTDMQATVYEEPWNDVIGPLWKKAVERSDSKDDGDLSSGEAKGERIPPEGSEAVQTYSDTPRNNVRKIRDKCNIS
ncbi:guanylate-binding protein 1-like isoform X2 [Ruditapes philippinarum]|nr:guanylate-binding protein 1-like isoform X2 [Ruditapes philippinarum]XP_060581768.1 guanylate-binding protein 1-like isoform X2 [Ruditapes philippinarum]XP_060581769.1 guanylate-binding protein 1-like isoform X2 [Ruditapes philippinarum]XP_060581770.1 guanylate-binding protein 1-like isoform X2 [Ruditapes philippinarum]